MTLFRCGGQVGPLCRAVDAHTQTKHGARDNEHGAHLHHQYLRFTRYTPYRRFAKPIPPHAARPRDSRHDTKREGLIFTCGGPRLPGPAVRLPRADEKVVAHSFSHGKHSYSWFSAEPTALRPGPHGTHATSSCRAEMSDEATDRENRIYVCIYRAQCTPFRNIHSVTHDTTRTAR